MRTYIQAEKKIMDWFRKHAKFIFLNIVFGWIIYFLFAAQNLVNDIDGIWHMSNFVAGKWEISLGRGLLRYVDKLYFGVLAAPFIVTITLAIVSVANTVLMDLLSIEGMGYRYILSACLIASPIMCIILSHSYMAVGFSFAYFFSVLAVACSSYFTNWFGILLAGLCVAISMNCYQAYLGVTCVLIVTVFINMLLKKKDNVQLIKFIRTSVLGGVLGGILYLIIMKVLLWHGGVELASYKGAGNFTLKMIVENLPNSFVKCYQFYYDFFAKQFMYVRTSITKMVLVIFFLSLFVNVLYGFVRIFKENKVRAIVFVISILLIPAAGNASLLLAVGNTPTLLMSMGMIYTVVLFTVLIPKEKTIGFLSKRICAGILALIVWISVITVGNDQLALMEGKTATTFLTQNIVSELGERGYLNFEHPIALVGRPANNDTFAWNPAYSTANDYAKFGAWSTDAGNNRRSWLGVLNEYCGVNLSLCGEETYNEIRAKDEVSAMPEFPAEGSIIEVDGVVVVKVSDVY